VRKPKPLRDFQQGMAVDKGQEQNFLINTTEILDFMPDKPLPFSKLDTGARVRGWFRG